LNCLVKYSLNAESLGLKLKWELRRFDILEVEEHTIKK
jgi:hypothetical protein